MSFDFSTLVTDRTQADVNRVKHIAEKIKNGTASESELAEFNGASMKGAYNYTDLNRVGRAISYLASRMTALGCSVFVDPKVDWTENDWLTPGAAEHYLSDLRKIRSVFTQLSTTPSVPADMEKFTVEEANEIEKMLSDTEKLIQSLSGVFRHSGQVLFYSGFGLYFATSYKEPELANVYVVGENLVMNDGSTVSESGLYALSGSVSGENLTL